MFAALFKVAFVSLARCFCLLCILQQLLFNFLVTAQSLWFCLVTGRKLYFFNLLDLNSFSPAAVNHQGLCVSWNIRFLPHEWQWFPIINLKKRRWCSLTGSCYPWSIAVIHDLRSLIYKYKHKILTAQ